MDYGGRQYSRYDLLRSSLTSDERRLLADLTARGAWAPDIVRRLVEERAWPASRAYAVVRQILAYSICAMEVPAARPSG
jgi:hypothetical protein